MIGLNSGKNDWKGVSAQTAVTFSF